MAPVNQRPLKSKAIPLPASQSLCSARKIALHQYLTSRTSSCPSQARIAQLRKELVRLEYTARNRLRKTISEMYTQNPHNTQSRTSENQQQQK